MARRRKHTGAMISAVIAVLLVLSGYLLFGSQSESSEQGALRVGTEGTYAPFSYRQEDGQLTGYDVDVARAVGQKLGMPVEFVEAPWDSMLAAFDANKSDVIFNQASITPEREQKYDFSVPYSISHPALVVKSDNDEIKTFDDLRGKVSAQSLTSNYAELAESYGATLASTDGFSKSVELVISGQADATLNDDVSYYDYMQHKPTAPVKIATVSDDEVAVGAMVQKNNTELLNRINIALEQLQADGTLTELSEKYFKQDISY